MKRLIKMQPNHTVYYEPFFEEDKVIVVSNYDGFLNEVHMWPFPSLDRKDIAETDIGIWQPKGTKEREIKLK